MGVGGVGEYTFVTATRVVISIIPSITNAVAWKSFYLSKGTLGTESGRQERGCVRVSEI